MTAVGRAEQDALQAALAGEHAAVWTLALLGARTSQSADPALYDALRAAYDAHQQTRDELISTIAGLGLSPAVAAPAYRPPAGLDSSAGLTAAALAVEQSCLRTYVAVVAETTDDLRRAAVGLLDDTAVRALSFRGTPEMFPGAAELANR